MSIYGNSKIERRSRLEGDLRICDDCGYDGLDANEEVSVCGCCRGNSPIGCPDECQHCGATGHMMIACPECGGRLSLDYERLEPGWGAKNRFARFERSVATSTLIPEPHEWFCEDHNPK